MTNAKISRLFIALMISVFSVGTQVQAKEEAVFQGVYLSTDVFGYIYPIFVKDKYYSGEMSLAVNLNNRFFPVAEVVRK